VPPQIGSNFSETGNMGMGTFGGRGSFRRYEPAHFPLQFGSPTEASTFAVVGAWAVDARFKVGEDFRTLPFVRFLTFFAAKLSIKMPLAYQAKRTVAVIASCLHVVTKYFPTFKSRALPRFQHTHWGKLIWREFGDIRA
jgi:hypothetical protein